MEFEIGNNAVAIISLLINAVIVPWFLHKHKECKHLKQRIVDD